MKQKYIRPDHKGHERGIFSHNKAILRKTATVCALCGMPIDKSLKFPNPLSISIDHIIPISLGGKSTLDNLQATHLGCNAAKGNRIVEQDFKTKSTEKMIPQYIDWSNYEE